MKTPYFVVIGVALIACTNGALGNPSAPELSSDQAQTGPAPEDLLDAGSGTTWTDLYRDLFGPTGQARCSGQGGGCHGASESSGTIASGYVCSTAEGCRASLLSPESSLVQPQGSGSLDASKLVRALRRRSAAGSIVGAMPRDSAYVFSHDSINRIEAWVQAGAPDD
jgi:hypothetical protein